ncbi:hypothetical protein [Paenibacillus sp. NFR01]|uniref:hypothetical protein n=1 Tax=Paenibacillus sp. NFR01 TaxID=1566279 RepID=UPI0008AE3AA6|nr:hypothetical protein [Paenibacillus sp. NFR01]SET57728.1 hypothetical protein SAMN03159358_2076 [Paenibacillus sp. NFR01]
MKQGKWGYWAIPLILVLSPLLIYALLHVQHPSLQEETAEVAVLKAEKAALKAEISVKDQQISGLEHLFPQYEREARAILEQTAGNLPNLKWKTEEERALLTAVKEWIQARGTLTDDGLYLLAGRRVILSLTPGGAQVDGTQVVEAMYYELPADTAAAARETSGEIYPRPIGKEYIGMAQFTVRQTDGNWAVEKYTDSF